MADSKEQNERHYDTWETVAVAVLPPGWRNVFREKDGTLTEVPCPAILLQELRSIHSSWDEYRPDGQPVRRSEVGILEPPYETHVVAADFDDGHLASIVEVSNYIGTIGPGVAAETLATETAPVTDPDRGM